MAIKITNQDVLNLINTITKIIEFLDNEKKKIIDPKIEYWLIRILKKLETQTKIIDTMRNNFIKELGEVDSEGNYEIKNEENKKIFFEKMTTILEEEFEIEGNIYKKNAEEVFKSLDSVPISLKYQLYPILNEEDNSSETKNKE